MLSPGVIEHGVSRYFKCERAICFSRDDLNHIDVQKLSISERCKSTLHMFLLLYGIRYCLKPTHDFSTIDVCIFSMNYLLPKHYHAVTKCPLRMGLIPLDFFCSYRPYFKIMTENLVNNCIVR